MDGLRSIRALGPESLRGIDPAPIGKRVPKFEWIDPRTIYVEEAYQRDIGEAGTGLIRKIYGGFDWSRYKTPICVRLPDSGNVLVCIDGQHTATACATHPGIDKIPVMVVPADQVNLRAAAFVGHNRDRVALTAQAIYHGELTAGDAVACSVDRACRAAGANIPRRAFSSSDKVAVGTTMSIGTLKAIARRQGEEFLTRVLRMLVGAGRTLIKSDEIAAAAIVMRLVDPVVDDRLGRVVAGQSADEWAVDGRSRGIESGESVAAEIAKAWLRGLHIKAEVPKLNNTYGAARRIIATIAPDKPGFKAKATSPRAAPSVAPQRPSGAKPAAAPVDNQKAEKVKPEADSDNRKGEIVKPAAAAAIAPVVPTGDQARFVNRNGVMLDLKDRKITHRGRTVALPIDDGLRLVASLARVMPSIMDPAILARQVFGGVVQDPRGRIRMLVDELNPLLAAARLEIRTVPIMGNTLFDLGG